MTVAARTREAVRARPFLRDALAAGVVNYTAAARYLDVGDEEAVAAALRRYAGDLSDDQPAARARVRMESGLGRVDDGAAGSDGGEQERADALLQVGDAGFAPGAGSLTAVLAVGSLCVGAFRRMLGRCETADLTVHAAGYTDEAALVVVDRRDGPEALQIVEAVCAG
jgi:hypothetical protein